MSEPVHVLHVDDEPDFVDMTAEFLERRGDELNVETAVRAGEGLDMLEEDKHDCVVSDYEMPRMDGIEFLESVRERDPSIPFILFTGRGSEEIASEAISAGVTDYLQKGTGTDQYAILANQIENAVLARQWEKDAERGRHRLEQILKTVPACVVQINYEGEFVFANRRAEKVLGLEPDKVSKRTYNDPKWDITDTDGNPVPDDELPFRQVRDSGEPVYCCRHMIEKPDGTRKTLLVNGAPLFDSEGEVESTVFALTSVGDDNSHRNSGVQARNERHR
ncbi:MAG: response regulator [Halobacteriales archaeon]|nr:response regulator [Halobacteriales archaeon]